MTSYHRSLVTGPILYCVSHYSQIFVENREIFIPHLYSRRWHRQNVATMLSTGKTRKIGLPYAEESMSHFNRYNTEAWQTKRRTELLYNIARWKPCTRITDRSHGPTSPWITRRENNRKQQTTCSLRWWCTTNVFRIKRRWWCRHRRRRRCCCCCK